ncbi:MAG: PilZ domain-containing protein [Candidatus Omnitrophota bacterium]
MKKNRKAERRQCPRIEQSLPIKLAANGYDFSTSTENVSCTGAYCRINKYVPPFTKVLVKLSLPINSNGSRKKFDVECKGVVVRTDDESSGGFNVAVFFNEIKEEQKKKITKYVNQFLPENTPA